VTLTAADDGATVEVRVGDAVVARLPENPTTGFTWGIGDRNDNVLPLKASEYAPQPGAGVGGGGERIFTFTAGRAGTTRLALKLWREWEGDASVSKRLTFTIHVGA